MHSPYHDLLIDIDKLLDEKDSGTAAHCLRVGTLTRQICLLLRLPPDQVETIYLAGRLHDIGKMGVPAHILKKPARLTEEEWQVMREHPRMGAEMLREMPAVRQISEIVLHHHENWDGSGYPDGLRGEKIPYASRIITICDSIDAMTSYRSYRPARSAAACRDEIAQCCGTRYDPDMVRAALDNWQVLEAYL